MFLIRLPSVHTVPARQVRRVPAVACVPPPSDARAAQDARPRPGRDAHPLAPRCDAAQHRQAGHAARFHRARHHRPASGPFSGAQTAARRLLPQRGE